MKRKVFLLIIVVFFLSAITCFYVFAETSEKDWKSDGGTVTQSDTGVKISGGASYKSALGYEKTLIEFGGFSSGSATEFFIAFTPSATTAVEEFPVIYDGKPTQSGLSIAFGNSNGFLFLTMGSSGKDEARTFEYISGGMGDGVNIDVTKSFSLEIALGENPYIEFFQETENERVSKIYNNKAVTKLPPLVLNENGEYYMSVTTLGANNLDIRGIQTSSYSADTVAPVITVDFTATEGQVFSRINLPGASVTDNVDTLLAACVKVTDPNGLEAVLSENGFVPDKEGTYTVIYSASDSSGNTSITKFEINVKKPTTAEITFSSKIESTAELGLEFTVPVAVVTANSEAVRVETLKMYIVLPNALAPTEIADPMAVYKRSFDTLGTCKIYYVATDVWGNVYNSQDFIVNVVDSVSPVIEVPEFPLTYEVYDQITLPYADIFDADTNITRYVKITFNGKSIQHEAGVFNADYIGVYVATFVATDSSANSSEKSFNITVRDTKAPQISVNFLEQAVCGEEYEIPVPKVTDNYFLDNEISVSYTVYDPDGEVLEILDDKFTIPKEGTYKIIYKAKDGADNENSKTVYFTAKVEDISQEENQGEQGINGGENSGGNNTNGNITIEKVEDKAKGCTSSVGSTSTCCAFAVLILATLKIKKKL